MDVNYSYAACKDQEQYSRGATLFNAPRKTKTLQDNKNINAKVSREMKDSDD